MVKNIFKGVLIGLANIIPGVSGGTMAVSMGIYDKLIYCISHFFKEIKANVLFLAPLVVGMGIAVIASSFGIDYLFESFPVQTNLLFIGLILGSLPTIYAKVKHTSTKIPHYFAAVVFFLLVAGMAFVNGASANTSTLEMSITQVIILFFIGVIASATMVIPGVSGSMVLLLLGYYNLILDTIKTFIIGISSFDIQLILQTLFVLVPFGIGVLVGIIAIAKLIEFAFERFPMYVYWSIIGLLIASPIAIIMLGDFPQITLIHVLTGIVTFALGWFVSRNLGDKEEECA